MEEVMNVQGMLRSLDVIQTELDRLRADLTSELPSENPIGPNGKPSTVFDVLRGLRFLITFYQTDGHRLHPDQVSSEARAAGYDPRGTGGFYTGNGCLRSEGDYRVLTQVGVDWLVQTFPRYRDQYRKAFPGAPEL